MARKSATVSLAGDGLRFVVTTGSGHSLILDNELGDTGPRPAELVPAAVAACSAMDVISILRKKRQVVSRYTVEAVGEQREDADPHVFTHVEIVHVVEGPELDVEAVRRSIELSATRYCSVGGTLATGVTEIRHRFVVRSHLGEESGIVIVTGPHDEIALGRELVGVG